MRGKTAGMSNGKVVLDGLCGEFRSESLTGHCDAIQQLLGTRPATLIQPSAQLRKVQKGSDGLDQADAGYARLSLSVGETR